MSEESYAHAQAVRRLLALEKETRVQIAAARAALAAAAIAATPPEPK